MQCNRCDAALTLQLLLVMPDKDKIEAATAYLRHIHAVKLLRPLPVPDIERMLRRLLNVAQRFGILAYEVDLDDLAVARLSEPNARLTDTPTAKCRYILSVP
ncbi:MAG TPA: hypothetical protein VFN11_08375 [Ktedonobacterales bacterium]|nr:hypothetical protein [Ktedonobacterales bacterium]